MQSSRCDADDSDAEAGVQEGVVQVGSFVWRHAAIFACFTVEDEVDCEEGSAEDGAAVWSGHGG